MTRWATALIAVMLAACRNEAAPAEVVKPTVYVLTSLPLLFDEGFGLAPARGEAATFLRERYTLRSIDLPSQLPRGAVLLAAQPRALPAEELVVLDAWVRNGGKLLLLADPMLEWPSDRAMGDRLRPPVSFADTGLLAHWGLRLDAPETRGLAYDQTNGAIALMSPGSLVRLGGGCAIETGGWKAMCRLGKGDAVVVADADLLNVEAIRAAKGFPSDNLRAVATLLDPSRPQ